MKSRSLVNNDSKTSCPLFQTRPSPYSRQVHLLGPDALIPELWVKTDVHHFTYAHISSQVTCTYHRHITNDICELNDHVSHPAELLIHS